MKRSKTHPCLVAITLLMIISRSALAASSPSAPLLDRDPRNNVRVSDTHTGAALRQAVWGADTWLGKERCQQVFRDFRDSSGAPLADVLAERGITGREQLRRIFFYDGAEHPVCQRGASVAVTSPGSAVIYVCPSFDDYARDFSQARAVVVHELLHTLGLRENPPTSIQITNRVMSACGG